MRQRSDATAATSCVSVCVSVCQQQDRTRHNNTGQDRAGQDRWQGRSRIRQGTTVAGPGWGGWGLGPGWGRIESCEQHSMAGPGGTCGQPRECSILAALWLWHTGGIATVATPGLQDHHARHIFCINNTRPGRPSVTAPVTTVKLKPNWPQNAAVARETGVPQELCSASPTHNCG